MSSLKQRIQQQRLKRSVEREKRSKNSNHRVKTKNQGSPFNADEEIFEIIERPEEVNYSLTQAASEDSQSCSSFSSQETVSSVKWQNFVERKVFEDQLNQLQEQLTVAMIENCTLKNELHSSKVKLELEKVKTQLDYERQRNELLEKKLQEESKKRMQKVSSSYPDLATQNKPSVPGADRKSSDFNSSFAFGDTDDSSEESVPARRFYQTIVQWLMSSLYTFLDDFTDEPVANNIGNPDGDPLTVKRLKENIKRFGLEIKPYVSTFKGICDLLAWRSPPYTLIVFVVYTYAVWQGWFLPLFLLCLSFRLFINFLRYRQWNVSFNFFDTAEETKDAEEKDLGVSEKINLVMQVARKVQNLSGEMAISLEKIKSLLTWRHPVASRRLFVTVSAAFITSCVLPTSELFLYAGIFLAIKLFIINYIYKRFPRVRRKYDTTWRLWKELPTDIEYEKLNTRSETDKCIVRNSQEKGDNVARTKSDQMSGDDRAFCELFSLPESERPLPGWQGGRRCALINKEKALTAAFKNGKLYLTASFLCFERTKTVSPKNIMIPLVDIVRLEKAKPFSWMPGGGMAIEIAVVGNKKPYIFGAMINRDEIFDGIQTAGRKTGLSFSNCPSLIE